MKIALEDIEKELANPFFEIRYLGKESIRQRILSMEKWRDIPGYFHFIEWKKEDDSQIIYYSFPETRIGKLLIASTSKGICFLGFINKGKNIILEDFKRRFPNPEIKQEVNNWHKIAIDYCNGNQQQRINLHLRGTNFQIDIWKKLIRIPERKLTTYGALVPTFKGAQAIGTAVGSNPVSYILPCHRVVKNDGSYVGYHWGSDLKRLLLAYEFQNMEVSLL